MWVNTQWVKFVFVSYITVINSNFAGTKTKRKGAYVSNLPICNPVTHPPFPNGRTYYFWNLEAIESEVYWIWKRGGVSIAKDLGQQRVGQVFVVPSFLFSCHAITSLRRRRLEMAWTNVRMTKKSGMLGFEHGSSW